MKFQNWPEQSRRDEIMDLVRRRFPKLNEPGLLEEMAENGSLVDFKSGETLSEYGSYVRYIPLVLEGTLKVMRSSDNGDLFLYYVQAGEACASSFTCCLTQKKSYIRAVAEDDLLVLTLPTRLVDEWLTRYRSWKDFVMQSYEDRLMELVEAIDNIAFLRMDERLWQYLHDRTQATGEHVINATHQDIADDLHASREAISRLLKQLERQGKIKLGRNRIEIRKA
jgi:CRP/FNR family transcriptional regulator